jgi:hypothetical protein
MSRRRVRAVAIVLAACTAGFALPAAADKLYKCVDAAGITTIQNSACPKGQTQVWARETAPEPPPTPEQLAAAQARRDELDRAAAERAVRDAEAAKQAAIEEELAQADAAARRARKEAGPEAPDIDTSAPAEAAAEPPADAESREDACKDAKAFVTSLRAKPWIDLNRAQWQRVYGWVVQQCR